MRYYKINIIINALVCFPYFLFKYNISKTYCVIPIPLVILLTSYLLFNLIDTKIITKFLFCFESKLSYLFSLKLSIINERGKIDNQTIEKYPKIHRNKYNSMYPYCIIKKGIRDSVSLNSYIQLHKALFGMKRDNRAKEPLNLRDNIPFVINQIGGILF